MSFPGCVAFAKLDIYEAPETRGCGERSLRSGRSADGQVGDTHRHQHVNGRI